MDSSDEIVAEMLSHLKKPIPIVDHDAESSIAQSYKDRSVFITGASGFIGKALVEKLVRSCPEIKRIYLLIRDKRGKDIDERLNDLISSQWFDRIRELNNGSDKLLHEKLRAIKGDITLPKFGISADDMKTLRAECSVVFNSAATIKFVEPIETATRNNIYSVGQLVEFCNELDHLEALIHLSTAYSNCHKKDTIYEIFYEPPIHGDDMQQSIKNIAQIQSKMHVYPERKHDNSSSCSSGTSNQDDIRQMSLAERDECDQQDFYFDKCKPSDLLSLTNGSLQQEKGSASDLARSERYDLLEEFSRIAMRRSNRPNSYTFTKAVSESYLMEKTRALPERYLNDKIQVAVVRPSIVGSAWREPQVGLVDNYNGPTGAILSLYTGALQAMPGDGRRVADLVPVDMVTNMLIAVGWFLVQEKKLNCQANSQNDSSNVLSAAKNSIRADHGVYLFNYVSGYNNPLHWHKVTDNIAHMAYRYPSKFLTRLPSSYFFEAGKMYELYDRVNHKLPAYLSDFVRKNLLGQQVKGRRSALAVYELIKRMTETLTPFTSNQWRLCDYNTRSLFQRLSQVDQSIFHFDVKSIDWDKYLRSYVIGARIYTMKDDAKNVPVAMRALKRREIINSAMMIFLLFISFYLVLLKVLPSQVN